MTTRWFVGKTAMGSCLVFHLLFHIVENLGTGHKRRGLQRVSYFDVG